MEGAYSNIYFDDFQYVVTRNLMMAKSSIKMSIAWLNFDIYGEVLCKIASRGVDVYIIIMDDMCNARYKNTISNLQMMDIKVKAIRMPGKTTYMHNKFCIIDNKIALTGLYNWTLNATYNNFENLLVTENKLVIKKLLYEFKYIWSLSNGRIADLQNKKNKCEQCGLPNFNICILTPSGNYDTLADVYEVCGCHGSFIKREVFTINLYNNLFAETDLYEQEQEDEDYRECEALHESAMYDYLLGFDRLFSNLIIHAIGIRASSGTGKYDDYEEYIKIIWKNRFISEYISDRLEVDFEYYGY